MTPDQTFIPLAGGCRCGQARFRLEVAPIITHACHCHLCQRTSGAPFRVNAMIETEHLTLVEGAAQAFQGVGSHKTFHCPACRTALWSFHPMMGEAIAFVGVGVLDQGERLAPEAHYFVQSRHPWVVIPPGVPAFQDRGDPGKAGAGERIVAALAKGGRGDLSWPPPA